MSMTSEMPTLSAAAPTATDSPPSRTTILGSFLRGRPRNSSQSHTHLPPSSTTYTTTPPLPQATTLSTDDAIRDAFLVPARRSGQRITTNPPATGTGITSMLRRRRSAGNVNGASQTAGAAGTAAGPAAATLPPPPVFPGAAALGLPALGPSGTPGSGQRAHQSPSSPIPTPTAPGLSSIHTAPPATTATTGATPSSAPAAPSSVQPGSVPTDAAAIALSAAALNTPTHRIRLVPHLDTRRSLRFDAITRTLKEGDPALRIGRFTDRSGLGLAGINNSTSSKLAFRSKVVSRAHAEIWVESGGRFFVKDTKSSSGTFLNHVRLAPAGTESRPVQIKDGDILQLGVDYQGGAEDIYKSVKIRVEIGREWQAGANAFNTNALRNLTSLALPPPLPAGQGGPMSAGPTDDIKKVRLPGAKTNLPDCCICLFSVAIRQALFIAPCSHTFHFKCIRPLIEAHHPSFSCPLCRTYADLEEDVEIEIEYGDDGDNEEEAEGGDMEGGDMEGEDDNDKDMSVVRHGPSHARSPSAGRVAETTPPMGNVSVIDLNIEDDMAVDAHPHAMSGSSSEALPSAHPGPSAYGAAVSGGSGGAGPAGSAGGSGFLARLRGGRKANLNTMTIVGSSSLAPGAGGSRATSPMGELTDEGDYASGPGVGMTVDEAGLMPHAVHGYVEDSTLAAGKRKR